MKKWLLIGLAVIFLFSTLVAVTQAAGPGPTETEEEPVYQCSFYSQVVNIDDFQGYDQHGYPEVMARVDLGYYYYNSRTRRYVGVSRFFVYAAKDWTPTLRAAYFAQERPTVYVNAESDQNCGDGPYRGWVTYVRSNTNAQYDWRYDTGRASKGDSP